MKKYLTILALLLMAGSAFAAGKPEWETIYVPATSWGVFGNVTNQAGPYRIWPVATSGGGTFTVPVPADACTSQPIEPKLVFAQNGTWANKTAVEFVMTWSTFRTSGHPQVTYSNSQKRNNTANNVLNSTVQMVQFGQIPPNKVTGGGFFTVTVYRKGQLSSDTAGNTTIPAGMYFDYQRCRIK